MHSEIYYSFFLKFDRPATIAGMCKRIQFKHFNIVFSIQNLFLREWKNLICVNLLQNVLHVHQVFDYVQDFVLICQTSKDSQQGKFFLLSRKKSEFSYSKLRFNDSPEFPSRLNVTLFYLIVLRITKENFLSRAQVLKRY
jgi:hypothetical protein